MRYSDAGAQALLGKGIQVALTKDNSSSGGSADGAQEYGVLSFVGADLKFAAKKPKVRFSTTYLTSIRDVELQEKQITGQDEGPRCRIVLEEGSAGSSFSFFCTDAAGKLSSSEVTRLAANVLKHKVMEYRTSRIQAKSSGPPKTTPLEMPPRPSTFEELLDPLDLTDKYCAAFTASGIPIQNLGSVTREDLAELVGVTDRLDQINISAHVKRCFPEYVICVTNQGQNGPNHGPDGFEAGMRAVEGFSDFFSAVLS